MAPAMSPSSEDRATWPPSKLEAKPLQSPSGMGSPGMPVSARALGGGRGGTQECWGHRAQLEAWEHWGELGEPGGVCVSPISALVRGPSGNRVQMVGQPLQLALRTVT